MLVQVLPVQGAVSSRGDQMGDSVSGALGVRCIVEVLRMQQGAILSD